MPVSAAGGGETPDHSNFGNPVNNLGTCRQKVSCRAVKCQENRQRTRFIGSTEPSSSSVSPCPQCSDLSALCVKSFSSLRILRIFLTSLRPYLFTSTQPQLSFPHARFQLPRPRTPPHRRWPLLPDLLPIQNLLNAIYPARRLSILD